MANGDVSNTDKVDENKVSALHYAARQNSLSILKLLLDNGANVNNQGPPNFITVYYYGVQQGGTANTESVFGKFNELAKQSDSTRPWVAMTKTLGGNVSVYSYSTPHMTMSEMLGPHQLEFQETLQKMYAEDPDLDSKVRGGWNWIWSETWRFRPELSTTVD